MSQLLINEYLNDLATLKRVSGAQRESVVREAFKDLLKKWGRAQTLVFIPEHEIVRTARVVTVSLETVAITNAMAALPQSARERDGGDR